MTKIRLILLSLVLLSFSSCFEITETYTFEENGAYTIEYIANMGNMIDLFQSLDEDAAVELKDFKPVDTSITYTKILPDSIKGMMDTQTLNSLSNTALNLNMDATKGVFLAKVKSRGSSGSDLQSFLINYDDMLCFGEEKIVNSFMPKKVNESEYKSTNPILGNKDFEFIITSNSFERRLTSEAIEKYKGRNMNDVENIMSSLEIDLNIISKLVINLPRPAKSVNNKNATLSADKKQFVLNVNLIKAAGNPEILNFKIVY